MLRSWRVVTQPLLLDALRPALHIPLTYCGICILAAPLCGSRLRRLSLRFRSLKLTWRAFTVFLVPFPLFPSRFPAFGQALLASMASYALAARQSREDVGAQNQTWLCRLMK